MAENDSGRRRFIDWLLGTSVGALAVMVLYPVAKYIVPPATAQSASSSVTLDIGPDDLQPNSGEIFKFGSSAGILVKTPSGDLRAFAATCTHLSCIVQYREDISHIWCACHNGHFDLKGVNIQGPPPAPLEQYDVKVRGTEIVVSKRA